MDATDKLMRINFLLRKRIDMLPNYGNDNSRFSVDYLERLFAPNGTTDPPEYITFIESADIQSIGQQIERQSAYVKEKTLWMHSAYGLYSTDSQSRSSKIKSILQDLISTSTMLLIELQEAIHLEESHLLPPTILVEKLNELQLHLRIDNLAIPFPINNDTVSEFYKLSTVHIFNKDNIIIVSYALPIVELRSFTLHYLTAYPRKVKSTIFQLLLPDLEYVAIDLRSHTYMHIYEDHLSLCTLTSANTRICKLTEPIQSTHNTESCSVLLLTDAQLPRACNFRMTNLTHELWLQLNQLNSWLFVFPQNLKLSVNCQNKLPQTQFIIGAGILRLPQHCSAITEYIEIKALEEVNTATTYAQVESNAQTDIHWTTLANIIIDNSYTLQTLRTKTIGLHKPNNLEKGSEHTDDIMRNQLP